MVDQEKAKEFGFNFDTSKDNLAGFEQMDGNVMAIPFIRIAQKLSPELDKNDVKYIAGLEEGQFFNTTTREIYGAELNAIVLKFEHIYIEWKPDRGGFVNYHSPENAEQLAISKEFGKWETEDGNLLQENYVYMLLVAGHEHEGPVVLSLASSAIKQAKSWNRLMMTHVMDNGQRAMPYYLVWQIKAEYQKNDKGTWYSPMPRFLSYINEVQYKLTTNERLALPSKKVDYAQIEGKTDSSDSVEF